MSHSEITRHEGTEARRHEGESLDSIVTPRQRLALRLSRQGLPQREIAQRMGIRNRESANRLIQRGRKSLAALRELVDRYGGDPSLLVI